MNNFLKITLLIILLAGGSMTTEVKAADNSIAAPENVAAAPENAVLSTTGLASQVIKAGTATEHPSAEDTVTVHYTGWTTAGEMFDSSVARGEPTSFALNRVIKGWTEGLQLMVVGEQRRFWIPANLAYGENPSNGAPAGTLVFDVELLDIKKAPEAPKTPEDVAAAPAKAMVTDSGLASLVLKAGTQTNHPTGVDTVTVHYTGWTTDGKLFDSSVMRGQTISFPLNGVIKGWTEGLQLMVVGEKRRFWIPANLAYGENPAPGAPVGMLVFDVELFDIKKAPAAPEVPEDVAAIPSSATTSASGLASRVLSKGTGTAHPTLTSNVEVHYSGWTLKGEMFDSSVTRGEPITFPLNRVIKGWTEGVQLMVVGEKRRFWIPANLAYGENPGNGAPGGMLVFDIELLEIK
ncbi:MAG: FKBP-type peptidylprolyl isomerase [Gammaproteobacteria bacterium]|nr:MAG: FKBP-type peptidylprolyl isomerase [Gammaproteobacteria bacterium]